MKLKNPHRANVFRWTLGDCTKNGLSSQQSDFDIFVKEERHGLTDAKGFPDTDETKEKICQLFEETGTRFLNAMIAIEDECCGSRRIRAIPLREYISGRWTMFGGSFLWGCDSRFFENPIKIHDRVE